MKTSNMKISKKIVLLWSGIGLAYVLAGLFLSHENSTVSSILNRFIQSLLFFVSLFIILKEPNRRNKFIFLNFTLFFVLSFFQLLYDFVGTAFFGNAGYIRFFYFQYLTLTYFFLLSIAVVYLVIDLLFEDFKIFQKYLATSAIVFIFFGFLFHSFLTDPFYLFSTEDIKQWKALDDHISILRSQAATTGGENLSATALASQITLQSWNHGVAIGDLYPEENLRRIESLLPYMEGDNYLVLLLKPLYLNTIYMNVLLIGFVLLFFGYQYKKDPPQGAYIDKIMFLFLLFSSMEILHNWGYMKSIELNSLSQLFSIGQYITVFIQMMIVFFFGLRLQFITSVQGEFYETELATNPQQISRWRDWVDNMVLAQFFNFKIFNGRLFQNTSSK